MLNKADMRIESKLCHLSETKAVVQVNGWLNDKNVGSALAEGSTVELAEDKAISRLNKRLNIINETQENINLNVSNKVKTEIKVESPNIDKNQKNNMNQEPVDWSNELTAIDSEIKRLNWSREDEIKFLEEKIGLNNRSKITKYNDLVNYLDILKKIDNIDSSKLDNTNREKLIEESDNILRDLRWDNTKGRQYLQKEFNVTTRKELDTKQLTSFINKLKSIRNQNLPI